MLSSGACTCASMMLVAERDGGCLSWAYVGLSSPATVLFSNCNRYFWFQVHSWSSSVRFARRCSSCLKFKSVASVSPHHSPAFALQCPRNLYFAPFFKEDSYWDPPGQRVHVAVQRAACDQIVALRNWVPRVSCSIAHGYHVHPRKLTRTLLRKPPLI